MIVLYHTENRVVEVFDFKSNSNIIIDARKTTEALFEIAEKNKDRILIWCHSDQKENLNRKELQDIFSLKNMMMSFGKTQYLPESIGFIEDSPFLKVNKTVKYPTWLMSSEVGTIYASQLLKFKSVIKLNLPFSYALNSIAKLGMSQGLFCYSEPRLLINSDLAISRNQASKTMLFKFVKQHYKWVWSFFLLFNITFYNKQLPLFAFIKSLFVGKLKTLVDIDFEFLKKHNPTVLSIDVIIPTLGRKKYLYDFLNDLRKQSILPKKVIIVEQNEIETSFSELDYIDNETWPFVICHKLIHKTGACNARNLALKEVVSDYVFFADDDIRVKPNFTELALTKMQERSINAVTFSCLRPNDKKQNFNTKQWSTFGSGCSIVKRSALQGMNFNMVYEFNFGEDADYGMQLRNHGTDVIYFPEPEILHLKAPIGGFRKPHVNDWIKQGYSPKPSPTILYYKLQHQTLQQLLGYKLVLFLKYYRSQSIKNPIIYFKTFKKQWRESVFWANKLNQIKQ
ncbi:hypothetical protein PK35_06020 [Tamlana nanhaiensis]|uniref:Glycosyltransferase 2-like domain-containing protein n=1 Tax=Neotamlana nanhaiensis TaxID=1382798 RepID=A0A0D7W2U6_9FLAO|nr:glycosyltransferase [Tamlana nanhaiensis]KJD33411.1 hypothetical protein PK35_06020 [Tamlana nanhaiensis]